jgi:hypothetical protein
MSKKGEEYFEKFFMSSADKVKSNIHDTLMNNLFKKPKKDLGKDSAHFPFVSPGIWWMCDILYLPNDQGFQYCLTVVDVGSRQCDAEAVKDKSAAEVLAAFKKIVARKIIKQGKLLTCDEGKEFKSVFAKGVEDMGMIIKVVKKGRHRSVGVVERKNQSIGKAVHFAIAEDEQETGESSSEWVDRLPYIVKALNAMITKQNIKPKPLSDEPFGPTSKSTIDMLNIGDKVRVQLDEPQDITAGKRLHGKFRSSDIRWSPDIRIVQYLLMKTDQPIMYLLNGEYGPLKIETIAYTRNQLQKVSETEVKPQKVAKPAEESKRMDVEKILNRDYDKQEKQFYYLVKWRHLPKSKASWESKTDLMKDIPQMVQKFDKMIIDDPDAGYDKLVPEKNINK